MIHAAYHVMYASALGVRAFRQENIPERLVLCTALHR